MFKKTILICMILVSIILISCNNYEQIKVVNTEKNTLEKMDNLEQIDNLGEIDKINYSIWITYWDTRDLVTETKDIIENIDNICYFGAYFNKENSPFIPKETIESFKKLKILYPSMKYKSYLTFVNDLILEDNTSSLKDIELLYRLFENDKSMENHIEEILDLTIKKGFDGVEIDYERINKDMELWELFIKFINKLYKLASEKNLDLRIVLEPNVPLDLISLPKGPEYVIMCYNLYGFGTEPGPKANKEFIEKMIHKTKELPGIVNFALATGGYDFQDDGIIRSLTESEAIELQKIYNQSPVRDKESQSLYFNYIDDKHINHEVWYADKVTINYWIDLIRASDNCNISLWRMGGNLELDSVVLDK